MKFTLSWLKEHLDTNASLDQISTTLTAIGLEVESITNPAETLEPFTVAHILHAERHPEADKLQVCKVASDAGELQIVCGAVNARAGLYVALAKEGAMIPGNGMVIKKTKIRGVESNGMLCSTDELGISGDSAGIIELPESPIGASVAEVLGLNDPVIDIAITPNRADCLGVRGIARDLAAAGLGTLKPLPELKTTVSGVSPVSISTNTPHCYQFIGCTVKGIKNAESPAWLKQRLEAVGQRSISTLVDITNYFTIGYGRPLHVYDIKKLSGNITVRESRAGETLQALNDKEYNLTDNMTVIADDKGPLALGGIMGGAPSGCDDQTTDVFLEVALFDAVHVAATGRALQIDSDARYRFERHVDPAFAETGARLAVQMILELCGGTASELVISGKPDVPERSITFKADYVKQLGGVDVAADRVNTILTSLGFSPKGNEVIIPSWRADVEGTADLVEEVLRIHGYDAIPSTPLPKLSGTVQNTLPVSEQRGHLAKRVLAGRGMMEAVTWSFLPEARAKQFGSNNTKLRLLNPISADLDMMRPSLLPNLLEAAKNNSFRGVKDITLFEVGLQFSDLGENGQQPVACGIRAGNITTQNYQTGIFQQTTRPVDGFDAKADALAVLQTLGMNKTDITTNVPSYYHPGRSGALTLGGKIILGYFGELHPGLLPSFELEGRVAGFEIFLNAIPVPRAKGKAKAALKLSDYQAVERDFAFIVDEKITAFDITKAINSADKKLITDVAIFDVYTGKGVDAGKKSVAVKVTLQAMDRTLSEEDITTLSQAIVVAASKGFGGQLRQ